MVDYTFDDLVEAALGAHTSDIHIHDGRKTHFRMDGELKEIGSEIVPYGWVEQKVIPKLSEALQGVFSKTGNVEAGLESHGYRVRASIGRGETGLFGIFRLLPPNIATPDQLGVPDLAAQLMTKPQGIVLVAGASGAGKSTTCASLLNGIGQTRSGLHILTLEDPIEYLLKDGTNVITQREMHTHYTDFSSGLRLGMRQDPDVIFIGELRDESSAVAAISAAGSGHLVLATIHSYDAVSAVNSLLWLAGAEDKAQVRSQIAYVLLGVLSQRLVRLVGGRRAAAFELLVNTEQVAKLIMKPDGLAELGHEIDIGGRHGHILLEDHLADLVVSGLVDENVALGVASNRKVLWSRISYKRETLKELKRRS